MNLDKIKKWEDEAHNYADHVTSDNPDADWNAVFHERFAQLARADERERCAQIIDANIEQCYPDGALYEVLLSNAAAIRSRKDEE